MNNKFNTDDGDSLEVDQLFARGDDVFFVEQKIRDDHDSTKKRGQIQNFGKKVAAIRNKYPNKKLTGYFYFIDSGFSKNRNYYTKEIKSLAHDHQDVELKLEYGNGLFDSLGIGAVWPEIQEHLKQWKREMPELPEINFDKDSVSSFNEIRNLEPGVYIKLFSNVELDGLLLALFPQKATLLLLQKDFADKYHKDGKNIHKKLQELITGAISRLNKLSPDSTFPGRYPPNSY